MQSLIIAHVCPLIIWFISSCLIVTSVSCQWANRSMPHLLLSHSRLVPIIFGPIIAQLFHHWFSRALVQSGLVFIISPVWTCVHHFLSNQCLISLSPVQSGFLSSFVYSLPGHHQIYANLLSGAWLWHGNLELNHWWFVLLMWLSLVPGPDWCSSEAAPGSQGRVQTDHRSGI